MKLPELKSSVNNLEDAIITLSGPALAISSVLAIVDLLTGGHILQQYAWFSLAWALCLALTLDFQILALGARSHQIYLSDKKPGRKAVEIGLCILIAVSIAFVSVQMQSIIARVNSFSGMTVEQAASQLGINTIWLIWERSALVLAMIFLSGWFREVKQMETKQESVQPPMQQTSMSDETANRLLGMIAEWQEWRVQVSEQLGVLTEQVTIQPGVQHLLTEHAEMHTPVQESEQGEQSIEQKVRTLLAQSPDINYSEVSRLVPTTRSTAKKYVDQIRMEQVEQKESEQ